MSLKRWWSHLWVALSPVMLFKYSIRVEMRWMLISFSISRYVILLFESLLERLLNYASNPVVSPSPTGYWSTQIMSMRDSHVSSACSWNSFMALLLQLSNNHTSFWYAATLLTWISDRTIVKTRVWWNSNLPLNQSPGEQLCEFRESCTCYVVCRHSSHGQSPHCVRTQE